MTKFTGSLLSSVTVSISKRISVVVVASVVSWMSIEIPIICPVFRAAIVTPVIV